MPGISGAPNITAMRGRRKGAVATPAPTGKLSHLQWVLATCSMVWVTTHWAERVRFVDAWG